MDEHLVSRERLQQTVIELCRTPRPAESVELEAARSKVTSILTQAGWSVVRHHFSSKNSQLMPLNGVNLIAVHPKHLPVNSRQRLCIGAHLDSVTHSPGADDNGSAVAALLEISRVLPTCWPDDAVCDLELIFFDLEECGMLGGAEHARLMMERKIPLVGMISLEMLGYCDHRPGSQTILPGLEGVYADTGNFIGVVGNSRSLAFRRAFCEGMLQAKGLPVEWLDVPGNGEVFPPTRLSDHSPFWDRNFPALMVTDTSFLRNPHYHTSEDTWETLDYDFLQKVTHGCLLGVKHVLQSGAR